MSDQSAFKNPFLSAALGSEGMGRPFGTQALQAWTQAQAKLLENTETLLKDWFERNRAAADATVSALQKISESKDPAEMTRLWSELATGQMQRATENCGALYEQCMTAWQQLADSARQACSPEALARDLTPPKADERPVTVRRAAS